MRSVHALILAALSSGAASAAPTIFAVDAPTGTLVRVNAATGHVVEVGVIDLGPGTGVVTDLASDGDRLFALTLIFPNGAFVGEVNPNTAGTMSSAQLTIDGLNATNAIESLAVDSEGRLIVALWGPDASNGSGSNSLGALALTGEVTGIVSFGADADFDGLGLDPDGGMVGLDREPGPDHVDLLNVSYAPADASLIVRLPFSQDFNFVDDCAVLDGDIVTIDLDNKRINRHDRLTGAVTSFVPYPAAYAIYMLTIVDLCDGDVDGSGLVDFADLNILLSAFNSSQAAGAYDGRADRDTDGDVDFADLNLLLSGFNTSCP